MLCCLLLSHAEEESMTLLEGQKEPIHEIVHQRGAPNVHFLDYKYIQPLPILSYWLHQHRACMYEQHMHTNPRNIKLFARHIYLIQQEVR